MFKEHGYNSGSNVQPSVLGQDLGRCIFYNLLAYILALTEKKSVWLLTYISYNWYWSEYKI